VKRNLENHMGPVLTIKRGGGIFALIGLCSTTRMLFPHPTAFVGSLLIFHVSLVFPLVIALLVMGLVSLTARVLSSAAPAWVRAS
jgi:hypothetical protein